MKRYIAIAGVFDGSKRCSGIFDTGWVRFGAPGFTLVVIGVLALGALEETVAMFSVVDAVLLKPLPFPSPERIVRVWAAPRPGVVDATTVPQFLAWKRLATDFDALASKDNLFQRLSTMSGPTRLAGKAVTAAYFQVFATGAERGRTFTSEEDQPGAARVVVLSHAAWQTYFGSDSGILRQRVVLDGESYQVIGVLQAKRRSIVTRLNSGSRWCLRPLSYRVKYIG